MRTMMLVLIVAAIALPAQSGDRFLSGKDFKARVETGDVLMKSSADYEFPVVITLRANGSMEGVSGNGYIDVGSWWLRGDILCHKWEGWFDGLRKCYAVAEAEAGLTLTKPTAKHFKNAKTRLK